MKKQIHHIFWGSGLILLVVSVFLMAACDLEKSTTRQQEETRDQIMDRANQQVPVPNITNFQTRQSIAKWLQRNDDPSRVFFVYVMAHTGNIIGYYTASSRPVSYASFLTPPDRVERHPNSTRILRQAPGADGVYYGEGSGNNWFFFDAETDALVEIVGLNLFVSDQPLELDAEPIRIRTDGG